jgi:type II secretory pathway component PulF
MKYKYQARSKDGQIEAGMIEASSKEAAVEILSKYNIFATSLLEVKQGIFEGGSISFFNKVSKKDLAIFSRQLSVMLESRVPVVQSLQSLSEQTKKKFFKEKIIRVAQLVDEGNSLSEAFSAFPEIFSVFYINLTKSGEASGKIAETLNYLSQHLERESDINSQIKSAMIYPVFVIAVLVVVMGIVMFVVMPKLIELVKQSISEPPFFTMLMLNFYGFLMNFWWLLALIFVGLVVSGFYYLKSKDGRRNFDIYSLRIPLIGEFFQKTYLVRFAENLSTLISAGLPITTALKITKDTIENFTYKEIISEVERNVLNGEKISSTFKKYPKFVSPFVVQMIQVGEDTGKLDKNLMEIVNFYQKEIKRDVDTFTALLEPILIIFLGICVAFLAVSVLSPLYSTLGTI